MSNGLEIGVILKNYYSLFQSYEEAKYAKNKRDQKKFGLALYELLSCYYDKIQNNLTYIDDCKLEEFMKDLLIYVKELLSNSENKGIEKEDNEKCGHEESCFNILNVFENVLADEDESLQMSRQRMVEELENQGVVKFGIENKKTTEHKEKSDKTLLSFFTKDTNLLKTSNVSKENQKVLNANVSQVCESKENQIKWKNSLPQYPLRRSILIEEEQSNIDQIYFRSAPKLPPLEFDRICKVLENLSNPFKLDEQLHSNSWNQNIKRDGGERQSIELFNFPNSIASVANIPNTLSLNPTNLIPQPISFDHQDDFLLEFPRDIANNPLPHEDFERIIYSNSSNQAIETTVANVCGQKLDDNKIQLQFSRAHKSISVSKYRGSGLLSIQPEEIGIQQQSVLSNEMLIEQTNIEQTRQVISTRDFYNIRTRKIKPPDNYQNWLDFVNENGRPFYYETPEKKIRRKKHKRKQNTREIDNDLNEFETPIAKKQPPLLPQELDRSDLSNQCTDIVQVVEDRLINANEVSQPKPLEDIFKKKFKIYRDTFLKSNPQNYIKLTKFEKYSFSATKLADHTQIFKTCNEIAKNILLKSQAKSDKNIKPKSLLDNDIVQILHLSGSKNICLSTTKYLNEIEEPMSKISLQDKDSTEKNSDLDLV